MVGKVYIPKTRIFILRLNLKKVTTDVERSAYNQLTSYEKIPLKSKRVQGENEFYLENTQCGNRTLKNSRFNCKSFLESEDSKIRPHQIRIENICTEMPHI